ncbi:MAG: 5'-methylthioadenosine/adenosylhomocysteine nucleosidase [Spirochaetaceae bacterium]|jgi:adenosylhomocysteine nucleosidase|nr:5'-methylthioadenosine/adenosylhomocysteine nucleosidase [Spirochaetaceae bacterium]
MIGIIGAMEEEVRLLKSKIEQAEEKKIATFTFLSGLLEGKQVCLLQCGIGKVNAAVGCALLIHTFEPSLVINTGSAGGIRTGLKCGDVVIAKSVMYHDVDLTAFDYQPGQIPGMPQVFSIPDTMIALTHEAIRQLKNEAALPETFYAMQGLIASGDTFMHEPYRISTMRSHFPDIDAVEMEAAAITHTCLLWHVPTVVIRAVSDNADYESPLAFNEFLPIASRHSAEIVRRIIKLLP